MAFCQLCIVNLFAQSLAINAHGLATAAIKIIYLSKKIK